MATSLPALLASVDGWQVVAILARQLTYASCLFASGGVFFLALFGRQLAEEEQRRIRRVLARAALVAIALSVLRVAVVNGMLSGEASSMLDPALTRAVLATHEGPSLLLRVLGLALVLLLGPVRWQRLPLAVPLLGAVLASLSFGLVGHADELYPQPVSPAHGLIALHLLAVAFWLGALWPLHGLVGSRRARNGMADTAALVARFGQVALWVVSLLVAAGGLLLWLLLGSFNALWQIPYGWLMLAKLAAAAVLLGLAALNKLRFTPRLLRGDASAGTALRRAIAAEMVVAALILLATAAATTLAGPPMLR